MATTDLINKTTNLDVTVRSTSGSLAIIQTIAAGQADIAFGTRDNLWGTAYLGAQDFEGNPQKHLRAVLEFQVINFDLVVPRDRPIRSIEDFKGRRIGWHTTSSMQTVDVWLRANGLDPDEDITKITVPGQREAVQEIIAGRCDAVWGNIFSNNAIELAQAVGTVFPIPWKQSDYNWMNQNEPLVALGTSLRKLEPGVREHLYIPPEGVVILGTLTNIASREDVSADVIYTYVKAWLDNIGEIQQINPAMAEFTPDLIQTPSSIPYHEGAIKALKEAGMWTAEMEQAHQEALAK
ncbi:TAXI family TRAP transporter solute-binding subunit [Chloroflexota bacterium]